MRTLNLKPLLIIFLNLLFWNAFTQPSRHGSIDLTGDEGRYVQLNHDGSNTTMGVEGNAFTVEGWVYVTSNADNDFNFFRFVSGRYKVSVHYRGDGNKNGEAWGIDTEGLPETGNSTRDANWSLTYKSGYTPPTFLNTWHHVAFTVNTGSTVTIYIDGVQATYSTQLTYNGSGLNRLFPNEGDGKCEIGGKAYNSGVRGKFYVGEIRVWNTILTSSEVSKYYNEEVNKAHPKWNNLVRYYLGTESTGTGSSRTFEDRSPINEYDGIVSGDDVGINSSNHPTVLPPAFNDSDFTITYSANDCQTTDIDITWTNIRAGGFGYLNVTDVYYQIRREGDDKVIYTGTNTSTTDTDVSEGSKKRYKLRTYWTINGGTYYSDDEIYSDYGTIKRQYNAPTNFIVSTDKCDKSIELEWSAADGNPPYWKVERSTSSTFASGNTTLTSTLAGTTTTYIASNQTVETNLYFRVSATGNDENACAVGTVNSSIVQGFTSKTPSAPTNMTITQNLVTKTLNLSWTNPSGNNADSWIITRKKFDGSDEVTYTTALGTTTYSDADLQLCQTYSYSIAAVNECATDGVYATTDLTGNVSTDLSAAISSMTASKGYYPDAVQLEWSLNGSLSNIDRFRLYRSKADQNSFSLIKILDNDLTYTDETAVGGSFYNYKIVGEAACENNTIYTNEGIDMGFIIPFGVANGHIEYDGGNAVEDVTINFENQTGETFGHALEFSGTGYVKTGKNVTNVGQNSFSMEAWVKTTCVSCAVMGKSDLDNVWESGEKVFYLDALGRPSFVGNGSNYIISNTAVNDDNWHHIAVTYNYTTKVKAMYVDGIATALATSNYSGNNADASFTFTVGMRNRLTGGEAQNNFTGIMDEIRVWNYDRTADQIYSNYNRSINSNQDGLKMYFRCDEGVGSYTYDASNTDSEYNKNDGQLLTGVEFSDEKPASNLLGVRGTTDEYGDYTVDYIPYSNGGQIYRVTPSLGQHKFQPSSRTVFIGDGAQTQNGLDFTDISSFVVSGKVTYYNSQVPVEGVTILLDGKEAIGADNKVVRSDANGDYSISVPIGSHFISVEKDNHIFSEGNFPPLDAFGSITFHEFTENVTVNFTDSTKIKVAGRVIGGTREAAKEIGFDLSTNNIGVADLQFKLLKEGYDIDLSSGSIYDALSLTTDAVSGEYELSMIPEKWVVTKAGNNQYFVDDADLPTVDLSSSLTPITVTDTIEGSVESYTYHHKLQFVIRQQPQISVTNKDGSAFEGDKEIVIVNQETGLSDTLDLTTHNYFSYPVFQMGKMYNAKVSVFETYNNAAHPNGAVTDKVPVNGANISIANNLMLNPESITGTTNASGEFLHTFKGGVPSISANGASSYTQTMNVYADIEGTTYTWRSDDIYRGYVLGAKPLEGTDFVTYGPEVPEIVLRDPPGSNSFAYIEKGSSFSTTKGYSFGMNSNTAFDLTLSSGVKFGVGGSITGPLLESEYIQDGTNGLAIRSEYNSDGNYSESWSFTKRIQTSSDPEDVGADADLYIGKGTNLFMSKSNNVKILPRQYCIDNGLTYYETGNEYVIGLMEGIVMDDQSETFFVYSQKYILNELIPELINLRDRLFLKSTYVSHIPANDSDFGLNNDDPDLSYPLSYTFTPATVGEMDSVAYLNQQIGIWLGMIGTNEMEKAKAELVENISIDGSSGVYSSEITETRTAANSFKRFGSIKYYSNTAAGYLYMGSGFSMNYSADVDLSYTSSGSNTTVNQVKFGYAIDERDEGDYYSIDVKKGQGTIYGSADEFSIAKENTDDWLAQHPELSYGFGGGSIVSTAGFYTAYKIFTSKATEKVAANRSAYLGAAFFAVDMASHLVKMGLIAANNDVDNLGGLDVDVSGFSISSPIFHTRGGQSRCPHEGITESMFYLDESDKTVELATSTLRREVPVISVENPVISNVPEDESAQFRLYLQNESESNSNMWYDISILEETNPDGAILLIDGVSPERSFQVVSGATVTKTLTVQKGRDDVYEYDSIGIVFHSTCQYDPTNLQYDIGDTVYISARFLPACSDVNIKSLSDNWIINYDDNNEVAITLDEYNLNLSTLQRIDFQYKTMSGSPITAMAWFKDTTSSAYQTYTGSKAHLNESTESFIWDIKDLTDRAYQLRARAVCIDGSITESSYISGIIDRVTPTVFGTPSPSDGILGVGEDISLRYNETIESGLVKDHNISVRSVLNGAAVSHSTYVSFNGTNEFASIPSVSFNNKSFTVEYWLKKNANTSGVVFAKGAGSDKLEIAFNSDESISIAVGTQTYTANPVPYYTAVTPANAWHHWGLAYDNATDELSFFMDDQILFTQSNVVFSPRNAEDAYLARSVSNSNHLAANIHEMRIWEKALTVSESYSKMNETLAGSELSLYGYWPMNEGNGVQAIDETSNRHMNVKGQWDMFPGSDAFSFNGTNQYLSLDGKNIVIADETNFTVEFWFKTATPASTKTIFSSGRGNLSDTLAGNTEYALSVNALSNGQLQVVSNGKTFVSSTTNYFDSKWHHFALVVDRKSNTRSYVDGALQKSSNNAGLRGLAGATLWLGARGFKENMITTTMDQYFSGSIDEFRIWNSARSLDLINAYKNAKLNGDEAGLLSYLPFEEYVDVMGTIVRETTLNDEAAPAFMTQANAAVATGGETFVDGASIRDVRPVQDIPFDYVVNGDEIVITPLVDAYRIEGQTLEISVSDINDLNGNKQLSTISWTAYVEQNELVWQESEKVVSHTPGVKTTFTATIVNRGGVAYSYTLDNLPSWLTTTASSGTVSANATKTVTFTVNEGLNVGYYEQGINLSTSLNFDEKLVVKVNASVTAPDWTFESSSYQYSMNVFGRVIIEDIISTDANDMVGAFVNDELRGVANVEYVPQVDAYMVFLTIYSNEVNGEEIELRVWDASEGRIYNEVSPDLTFASNDIIGSSAVPQDIRTNAAISSTLTLKSGWTWVSFNLNTTKLATVDSIFAGVGENGDLVKGQEAFDIFDNATGWLGNLTIFGGGLKVEDMYKVYVKNGGSVRYSGTPVDAPNTNIDVASGWNYVGYTPQVSMTVTEALAGLEATSGTLIKSQSKFSMYDNVLGWIGSLKTLSPGEGYMVSTSIADGFAYPENSSLSTSRTTTEEITLPEGWSMNIAEFADNMSIVANVSEASKHLLRGDEVLMALFNNEVRGYAAPIETNDGRTMYFLSVSGDKSETFKFVFYHPVTKEFRAAENLISFEINAIVGNTRSPYTLNISSDAYSETEGVEIFVLPNPFTESIQVNTNCDNATVQIYNTLGTLVHEETISNSALLSLAPSLPAGTYTLKISGDCGVHTKQIIKY